MRSLFCLLLLAAFAFTAAADTNVTGKWSGTFNITGPDGQTKESSAYLVLKQNGGEITGTLGPGEDEQYPIAKGKIEGDKITLEADHEGHSVKFQLVLADERIKGDATMSGEGQTMKAKLDVGRAKDK